LSYNSKIYCNHLLTDHCAPQHSNDRKIIILRYVCDHNKTCDGNNIRKFIKLKIQLAVAVGGRKNMF